MIEIWKEVKDIDGYLVSNKGRIKSTKRKTDKILKPKIDKDGYHEYGLCCNVISKVIYRRGHRLVAQAFLDNPESLPIINHKNLIKDDNRVENLEWCSHTHNTIHGYKNQPEKRIGRGFCDLEPEDIKKAVELYNKGYMYHQLNDYFNLETKQDLWSDVFKGGRFSEITGITEDIRDGRNPSRTKTNNEVMEILKRFFINKEKQSTICSELKLNPSYVSRIINRKKRVDIYDEFMRVRL